MPIKPLKGETKSEFISRCIRTEVEAGRPQKEAVGMCHAVWDRAHSGDKPKPKTP